MAWCLPPPLLALRGSCLFLIPLFVLNMETDTGKLSAWYLFITSSSRALFFCFSFFPLLVLNLETYAGNILAWYLSPALLALLLLLLCDLCVCVFVISHYLCWIWKQILATSDAVGGGMARPSGGRRYSVQVLLGKRDDPLLSLYARQLLEQMKWVTEGRKYFKVLLYTILILFKPKLWDRFFLQNSYLQA